jgi:hypothetical protein
MSERKTTSSPAVVEADGCYAPLVQQGCWCHACDDAFPRFDDFGPIHGQWRILRFVVCPTCGNKRCPRAAWHRYKCTDSNDVGQSGELLWK